MTRRARRALLSRETPLFVVAGSDQIFTRWLQGHGIRKRSRVQYLVCPDALLGVRGGFIYFHPTARLHLAHSEIANMAKVSGLMPVTEAEAIAYIEA
jgi:hypothetical protein